MLCCCVLLLSTVAVLVLSVISWMTRVKPIKLDLEHVLITGGSSGIGQALCIKAAKEGAHVTIVARNQDRLAKTQRLAEDCTKYTEQKITSLSLDVTTSYDEVYKAVREVEESVGPISVLINCAGTSISRRFEELHVRDFQAMLDINVLGSVAVTKAVVKSMKTEARGRIVFVSSQAGQVGVYGMTAYCASKFALRGLAEALQMELKPYNIYITIAFPPDTETPGFKIEQIGKPEETKLLSETSGLCSASEVASIILRDTKRGKFLCHMGLGGYMLSVVTSGMSPVTSVWQAFQQMTLMGLFRLVALLHIASFDRIILRCKKKHEQSKKTS